MPTNREELIKAASIVRPALAPQAYIPALTHLRFDDDGVTAYDDIHALSVRVDHDLHCCVPGDLFIKALNGFQAKDVKVTPAKDESVTLTSGKGKIKLPTLPVGNFPFRWPAYKSADVVVFDDDMIKGLQRCLVSVGTNANHPAQMGVTLDQEEGRAVFFSTDNFSITRYETDSKISLPADAPEILPTFFCEQLLSLAKAFPTEGLSLYLLEGALLLIVGDDVARLYNKTLVDLQPLDFPTIVKRHTNSFDKLEKELVAIPAGWEETLERSLLVLSSAVEKRMTVDMDENTLHVEAKSDYGEHDEDLKWDGPGIKSPVQLNPQIVLRGSANCTHLMFGKTALILATKDVAHLHLVAYYGK